MRAAHSHATVGKTSLLISYVDDRLPEYTPTLFEHGECDVDVDGQRVAVHTKAGHVSGKGHWGRAVLGVLGAHWCGG